MLTQSGFAYAIQTAQEDGNYEFIAEAAHMVSEFLNLPDWSVEMIGRCVNETIETGCREDDKPFGTGTAAVLHCLNVALATFNTELEAEGLAYAAGKIGKNLIFPGR